jgi:hypothetical protein
LSELLGNLINQYYKNCLSLVEAAILSNVGRKKVVVGHVQVVGAIKMLLNHKDVKAYHVQVAL